MNLDLEFVSSNMWTPSLLASKVTFGQYVLDQSNFLVCLFSRDRNTGASPSHFFLEY